MESQEEKSWLSNLLGTDGLSATLFVKLDRETYFYLAIAIIVAMVVGSLLGGIAKDVVLKK